MSVRVYIKCQHCQTLNVNREYCQSCNQALSVQTLRDEKRLQEAEAKTAEKMAQKPSKIELWIHSLKNNRFWLVRFISKIVSVIFMVVISIGAFFAWLIAMIAA